MQRAITGFRVDEAGDPVAVLACGHGQHVRHKPPMTSRPWVLTEEGRASKLGALLGCVRCDRLELPEGFAPYKVTPDFDEATVPKALLAEHTTRSGVWGLVEVTRGMLVYVVDGLGGRRFELTPGTPGVVAPEVVHHVEIVGPVVFRVRFHRAG